jgi:hypothetical protein
MSKAGWTGKPAGRNEREATRMSRAKILGEWG